MIVKKFGIGSGLLGEDLASNTKMGVPTFLAEKVVHN